MYRLYRRPEKSNLVEAKRSKNKKNPFLLGFFWTLHTSWAHVSQKIKLDLHADIGKVLSTAQRGWKEQLLLSPWVSPGRASRLPVHPFMPIYSWNTTCCKPLRVWDQGKPEFDGKSKYMCQSLEVVLQQSKDGRDTLWTAWFSKSHQMIQEGWQSLYSTCGWCYTGSTGVLCGLVSHTRLLLMPLPPPLRGGYLANRICRAKECLSLPSHLSLSAPTVKSYLRPHCSSCKTRSLKKRERVTTLLFISHLKRITDKGITDTTTTSNIRKTEPCKWQLYLFLLAVLEKIPPSSPTYLLSLRSQHNY